jgi:hypothetical protein
MTFLKHHLSKGQPHYVYRDEGWYPKVEYKRGVRWPQRELSPPKSPNSASDEYLMLLGTTQCVFKKRTDAPNNE